MLDDILVSVRPLSDYKLLLSYAIAGKRIFDVKPYIRGSWFGQLAERKYFEKVKIISATGIECPDGQDVAPHELFELSIPVTGNSCNLFVIYRV